MQVELRLARCRAGLQHIRDRGQADASPFLRRLQIGFRLRERRALCSEKRAAGDVLEVSDLNLEHDVLNRRVVAEGRREHALARAGHTSGPTAEVEEQIRERRARRQHRLLHAHASRARHGLDALRGDVAIEGREPFAPRRSVRRRRRLRVGPGKPGL